MGSNAINTYEVEKPSPVIASGMLSSPHIKYCILNYSIITCEGETQESLFKQIDSAIYKMRLGNEVWGHNKKGDFYEDTVPDSKSITLEPNSLTYLTTKEAFNLPKDIIVRFNLKSGLVHKGLLLGTGPIVDPEFQGRLLIPVHNFSNSPVRLAPGEAFINVEFTKTLNPEPDNLELKYSYVENDKWKFEPLGYVKKIGNIPSSSILEQYSEFEERLSEVKLSTIIATISILIALAALFYTALSFYMSSSKIIDDARNEISTFKSMLKLEEKSKNTINTKQFVLKHEYDELNEKYNKLIKELEFLKHTHKRNDQEAQQSH